METSVDCHPIFSLPRRLSQSIFLNDTALHPHVRPACGALLPGGLLSLTPRFTWGLAEDLLSVQRSTQCFADIPDKTFPHILTGSSLASLHPGKSSCALRVTSSCVWLCLCASAVGTPCSPKFLAQQCLGLRQLKAHWTFHSQVFVSQTVCPPPPAPPLFSICFSFYLFSCIFLVCEIVKILQPVGILANIQPHWNMYLYWGFSIKLCPRSFGLALGLVANVDNCFLIRSQI